MTDYRYVIDPALYYCDMDKVRVIEQWCNKFELYVHFDSTYSGNISFGIKWYLGKSPTPDYIVNKAYTFISDHVYDMVNPGSTRLVII